MRVLHIPAPFFGSHVLGAFEKWRFCHAAVHSGPNSYRDGPGEKDKIMCRHHREMREDLHAHLRGGHW